MKKEFKTLKGLVNFVKKYLIEEYGSLEEIKDCSIIEVIDKEIEQIIRDYAEKYVNISYKEERILTNKIEYADGSAQADGDFDVAFGDITLNYSSVAN